MKSVLLLAAVCVGLPVLPSLACAQATADQDAAANGNTAPPPSATSANASGSDVELAEVVITAQKRSERLLDVPISVTAVTGEQMAHQGITDVSDLTKIVPGFSFQQSTWGTPIFSIRGVGFYDTSAGASPTVSVYVDQVPLPYSVMTRGSSLDLERVEVLKGPQGTLFGQNSTGGAINYIAAKPTRNFQAGADADVGNFTTVNGQGFVSGPITDTLSGRFVARYEYRGPWQQSFEPNDAAVGKAPGAELGYRRFLNSRGLLDWKPADSLSFELTVSGWRDTSDTVAGQFEKAVFLSPQTPANAHVYTAFNSFQPIPQDNRAAGWDAGCACGRDDSLIQTAIRADWAINDRLTLNSISSYTRYRENSVIDADGTPFSNIDVGRDARMNSYFQELRLSGNAAPIRWMLGGNYANDDVFEDTLNTIDSTNGAVGPVRYDAVDIVTREKISTWAGFGSLDYSLTNQLSLQGSARYTDRDNDFNGCLRDPGSGRLSQGVNAVFGIHTVPGGCVTQARPGTLLPTVTNDLDESNVSYRGSINFKPDVDSLIYASVSRGYKAGSFTLVPAILAVQLAPAVQESVKAYEIGSKLSLDDRRVQLSAATFYYDYSNKQISGRILIPPFGALPNIVNIPKSRVYGAEFEATLVPVTGLRISGGVSYINSRIQRNPANPYDSYGNVANFIGESFPITPSWQGVTDAEYKFPFSGRMSVFAGGTVSGRTGSSTALGNATSQAHGQAGLRIPGYALLDLRAGVESPDGSWRVQLWGRNVTNRFYLLQEARQSDEIMQVAGMPATYGVSLSVRY